MIFKHPDPWQRCYSPSPEQRLMDYIYRLSNHGYDPFDHACRAKKGMDVQKSLLEKKRVNYYAA